MSASSIEALRQRYSKVETRSDAFGRMITVGMLKPNEQFHLREYGNMTGSNDDKATFMELGTSRTPPRPLLGIAVATKGKEIAEAIGAKVLAPLVGGKP